VNELFGFEPKNKQVDTIRHLLYDKRDLPQCSLPKQALGKALSSRHSPDPGIVEAGKLNYYVLQAGIQNTEESP